MAIDNFSTWVISVWGCMFGGYLALKTGLFPWVIHTKFVEHDDKPSKRQFRVPHFQTKPFFTEPSYFEGVENLRHIYTTLW